MFRKVDDFVAYYRGRADEHTKLLERLTDASLAQSVAAGHRHLGQLAWHIVQSIPGMANEVGLGLHTHVMAEAVPQQAARIVSAYRAAADELLEKVQANWSDGDMLLEDNMYGEVWKRGYTLLALISHEGHHIGQLTVLMRQAGLPVYGIYGPAKEEWVQYGMEQPGDLA